MREKEEDRRREGEFYTPTIWVDEAHKMIEEQFGENWKEEYVVWDPACGTGNLTRDYHFKELYCSTLNQFDIDIMVQSNYNPEATIFQFDFLNDSDKKLPEGLQNALKDGKKIIFLMNPPYGAAGSGGANTKNKTGIAKTKINLEMKKEKWGASSSQLYAQFLYKISKIENSNIAMFCSPLFLSGPSYKKFREHFFQKFSFCNGFLFSASHFSGTASNWGITFTVWKNGTKNENKFYLTLKENPSDSGAEKLFYNLDNQAPASKWVREEIKGVKTYDAPQMTSALKIKTSGKTMCGRLTQNALGYSHSHCNSVLENQMNVGLYSSSFSQGNGLSIIKENFDKVIALFTARKTIKQIWINDRDEYIKPNTDHPDYEQWNNDCLVYSLFNGRSNQSSMRQIEYKDKLWDIKNEWFWMSKSEILDLANDNCNDAVFQDCRHSDDRFVYNKLQETTLSPDAQEILNTAIALVKKSFPMRSVLQDSYPEYHLNCWDAGWYQIKKILKEYYSNDLKKFVVKYKKFEGRMREGVYKFGFLK